MKKILSIFILSMFVLSANAEVGGTITRGISTDMVEITTTKAGDTSDGRVYKETTKVYSTKEEFLKSEWKTCEVATDGCNTVQIWNGQAGASTMMYCEHIYGEGQQEQWSCVKEIGKLSQNDQNFYDNIKTKISAKKQAQISSLIAEYKKALAKLPADKQAEVHAKAIAKVKDAIFTIIMAHPQDIALPKKENNKYLTLSLLKFELMLVK